ncbi:fibroleukin isoform X3 [Brachyhypopomus gauderio]|uniref:fibroleukin isoform X3 n=1 Tax=Brachyhypopomus gauderio TaxID=698409 RepID=UPI004042E424
MIDEPPHDCSDLKKNMTTGVYSMTRVGSKHTSFHVFCDMEASGGGWTVIQRRLDGTISFNRTWDDYKKGFGHLTGEFWLGNDKIHWLTTTRAMVLRIELEDLDGVKEFAQYDDFYVANESLKYQLTIGGYSGTAGNAMQESKSFNHNQKFFSTPDRDNDEYSSGSCAAYYASGWWFDACMAANLNGKYYQTRYKGVRNGIFWGTWHNMSNEYYPTNERQSFRTVRMMMRPRTSSVTDF